MNEDEMTLGDLCESVNPYKNSINWDSISKTLGYQETANFIGQHGPNLAYDRTFSLETVARMVEAAYQVGVKEGRK